MATSRRTEQQPRPPMNTHHQLNMIHPCTLLLSPSPGHHPPPTTFNFGIGVFPILSAANPPPETTDKNGENEACLFIMCTDCGNRAKKDCVYKRCRACCKNNGFACSTHVRSTWVPASRRQLPAASSGSSSSGTIKRQKVVTSLDMSFTHQDTDFKRALPREVRASANFKCTRVTAVDGGEQELGYQATVHIGGHVFKGFLFDQGN